MATARETGKSTSSHDVAPRAEDDVGTFPALCPLGIVEASQGVGAWVSLSSVRKSEQYFVIDRLQLVSLHADSAVLE